MQLEYDEQRWPDLGAFRTACLQADLEQMAAIAARGHDWYTMENPDAEPLERLATVFQANYFASAGDMERLRRLLEQHPWAANHPWTAQRWRPLSQAVCRRYNDGVVQLLLDHGADPAAEVGPPGDRGTIAELARSADNEGAAQWMDRLVEERAEPAAD